MLSRESCIHVNRGVLIRRRYVERREKSCDGWIRLHVLIHPFECSVILIEITFHIKVFATRLMIDTSSIVKCCLLSLMVLWWRIAVDPLMQFHSRYCRYRECYSRCDFLRMTKRTNWVIETLYSAFNYQITGWMDGWMDVINSLLVFNSRHPINSSENPIIGRNSTIMASGPQGTWRLAMFSCPIISFHNQFVQECACTCTVYSILKVDKCT